MSGLVHELLEDTAARLPHRTALVVGESRISYADLDRRADRFARGLSAAGVAGGDRVVICLDNSVEAVTAVFGVLKVGAAFTLLRAGTKRATLTHVLSDAQPAALVTADGIVVPEDRAMSWASISQLPHERLASPASEDSVASIIYTSGTTGSPKGVVSLHRDTLFATRAIADYLGNSEDDVIFCSLYLGFSYGLYQLLTAVAVGATLILERGFAFPRHHLAVMAQERVTGLAGVPTMFVSLLRTGSLDRFDLSALRYLTNAAAPLPVSTLQAVVEAFPQAQMYSMYGQTECKRACYLPPEELSRRPGSVGRALPGTEAYVVGADGLRARPGVVGELVLRGPHLMAGYWRRPQETAACLEATPDGPLLHTGDLFRSDDDGFLYFVSRADDIIKCRGEKVNPQEIERALHDLPGVADVAAVGVPDTILGEAVKVIVVVRPGAVLTEQAVRAYCAQVLEDVMVPRHVEFRSDLPRSENGKLLRRSLRPCAA